MSKQMTIEDLRAMDMADFVTRAIKKLRKEPYKGVHSVYSGLNQAIKLVHPDSNPVEVVQALCETDKFAIRPVKGGVIVYCPEDAQNIKDNALHRIAQNTIGKILS